MNNVTVYAIIIVTVLLVHTIKFFRLYLAFYGTGMRLKDALKTFCIATPISMLIPAKLGEIFRVFAYGRQVHSYLRGLIVILLDRFMDTAALLAIMFCVFVFTGSKLSAIAYFFMLFLVLVLWGYLAFPHIYKIWKKNLLVSKATEQRIYFLEILSKANGIFQEMENVVKGRGIVLFFLSLVSWGIEIGGIGILIILSKGSTEGMIGQYLSAAMMGTPSEWLSKVIMVSVCILLGIYVFLLIEKFVRREKKEL